MTTDCGPGLDPPASGRQALADCLGDTIAIVLVELTAHAPDEAQALREAHPDRKAEIVFGGERPFRDNSPPARALATSSPLGRPNTVSKIVSARPQVRAAAGVGDRERAVIERQRVSSQ